MVEEEGTGVGTRGGASCAGPLGGSPILACSWGVRVRRPVGLYQPAHRRAGLRKPVGIGRLPSSLSPFASSHMSPTLTPAPSPARQHFHPTNPPAPPYGSEPVFSKARGEAAFTEKQPSGDEALQARIAELERFCGQLSLENQILKKSLASMRSQRGMP